MPGTIPGAALALAARLFSTFCTPLTPFAISMARATCALLSTVPVRRTVPPLVSTLICVPLTWSSARSAALTLVVTEASSTAVDA